MWIEMTSAAGGAEAPNSTNGVLKSLNVHKNSTSTTTWLMLRSDGIVMSLICRQMPAPSIADASYSSWGMPCSPAMTQSNANGQLRPTETTTSTMKLLLPISQNAG